MMLKTVMLRMEKTKSFLAQTRSSEALYPDYAIYSQHKPIAAATAR